MNTHYNKYGLAGGNSLVLNAALGRQPRTLSQNFHELAAVTHTRSITGRTNNR